MALPKHKPLWIVRSIALAGAGMMVLAPWAGLRAIADQGKAQGLEPMGAVNVHSILLLPIANETGSKDNDNVGPLLDDAIRLRLANVAKFRVVRFSRLLPSVQVGLQTKDLTQQDVAVPFSTDDDKDRASKLASRIATDSYFLGNVESVTKDPATQKVTVVMTANLFDTATGGSIRSFGVSGTAVPQTPTDTAGQVLQGAVDNAASQIAAQINGIPVVNPGNNKRHHSQRASSTGSAALVVIAGALLFAAFHHDSSSGGSSSSGGGGTPSGPPSPPSIP